MGLFRRAELRSISYQDVWGSGGDWSAAQGVDKYSVSNALGLSTVIGCVRRRAALLSQVPFKSYRTDADGFMVEVPVQPLLLTSPSVHVTRSEWFTQLSLSRDLYGNAYGWIAETDSDGFPASVDWLDPATVAPFMEDGTSSQRLRFKVNGYEVPASSILMVPSSLLLPGSPVGVAPLTYSGLVELGKLAQKFGSDWFRNGAVPSSLIYADAPLDEAEALKLKEAVVSSWRSRKPAVLGSGLRVESVKTDAASTSEGFLNTQRMVQAEICNVFGVPPEAFGINTGGSSLTYANREQQTQAELVVSFNDDIVKIEEHLTRATPPDQVVKASTGALLRSDLPTRYASYATGITAGFLTVDEARALEERRPLNASGGETMSARALAEALQKIYLAVGVVISPDEAREILNREGAGLDGPSPVAPQKPTPGM